jgi:hypothetical protein
MSIEQIVADRLAGIHHSHKHKFVMCGECKELFCPGCLCRDFFNYPEWISHIRCPYCKKKFDHEAMLRSRRAMCRGHYDPNTPPVWRVYKTLRGTRQGNRLKKKRRYVDQEDIEKRHEEEIFDYYFFEAPK